MSTNDSDLTSLKVYERESAIRFEYIEKRLDEGSANEIIESKGIIRSHFLLLNERPILKSFLFTER